MQTPLPDPTDNPDARILITGHRGSGKTQTARTYAQHTGGFYLAASPHAHISGLTTTVANEIALGLEQNTTDPAELTAQVHRAAADLGISHLLNADPLKLSGGQTQLVALASVLILPTPALALDEPLLGLDPTHSQKVLTALQKYPGPVLWTSPNPQKNEEKLATHRINLTPQPAPHPEPAPTLPAREPTTITARDLSISPHPLPGKERGKTHRPALQTGLNITLRPGESLILTGPNGSGKTTLLRTLAGLHPPASGQLHTNGKDPATLPAHQRAQNIQLITQNPTHHFLTSSITHEMRLGPAATATDSTRQEILNSIGLQNHSTHPLDLLPTQQHLLTLATALAGNTPCLLLDEPTARLDPPGIQATKALINAHLTAGGSAIISTHHPEHHQDQATHHLHLTHPQDAYKNTIRYAR